MGAGVARGSRKEGRRRVARRTEHGEIWWAESDKERPVVVASRGDPLGHRANVTCASVSRTIRGIPTEVPLDERDGLREVSVINCDDLFTIRKDRLRRRIGHLSPARLEAFHRALRFALAIPGEERTGP